MLKIKIYSHRTDIGACPPVAFPADRGRPGPLCLGVHPVSLDFPPVSPLFGRLRSCQTCRMKEGLEGDLVAAISAELTSCRKRGIERLDVRSHNQAPVPAPGLQRLAGEYLLATGRNVPGRIAQIKYLLRDAAMAFAAENEPDARLVQALFFGDSQHRVTRSAGELLDIARRQSGYGSEVRFRQARHDAFDNFAEFLPRFAAAAQPGTGAEAPETAGDTVPYNTESILAPEVQQQVATTGYIDNGEHFISLLSQAEKVTIVGVTNESLASMLRIALARKREALLRPEGCWASIRVVFLSVDLLGWVSDERGYPDPVEARLLRQRLAVYGRRTVMAFLRGLPGRVDWVMCDSPHFPPLIGTLFEMPDGRRRVQLLIRRRLRNASDHLYLEFDDTHGYYFSATFDEIVNSSVDENKLAPVGNVIGQHFRVTGTKYRWHVLIDDSGAKGWLAMVLVITWRIRDGRAEPLMQLRTKLNASRELDRLTHLADHIVQNSPAVPGLEFGLDDEIPMAAARSRVQMEAGQTVEGELRPLTTSGYLHPDKEHLFFFVYSYQLPEGMELWRQAEMSPVSVPELLAIRKNQVLRNATALCLAPPKRRQVRADAFEIAALNLILHDLGDMAQQLKDAATARTADFDAIAAELGQIEEQTRQIWPGYERDAELEGLSGLQFREFWTMLLPFYAGIGVPGAAEHLELINSDETKRAAIMRLSLLYHDERVMEPIMVEL
jgi:hypothetical protein